MTNNRFDRNALVHPEASFYEAALELSVDVSPTFAATQELYRGVEIAVAMFLQTNRAHRVTGRPRSGRVLHPSGNLASETRV